jgi:hypothetical protein
MSLVRGLNCLLCLVFLFCFVEPDRYREAMMLVKRQTACLEFTSYAKGTDIPQDIPQRSELRDRQPWQSHPAGT